MDVLARSASRRWPHCAKRSTASQETCCLTSRDRFRDAFDDRPGSSDVSTRRRIVIVGAGFAGLRAARALRRADADVTVIDSHNFQTFQPLLYQVATSSLNPADVAFPVRGVLRRYGNASF